MFEKRRIIRYIGNKTNLYDFIIPELKKSLKNRNNFYEFFSGTNAISFEINKLKKNIFANDLSLYSKIIFSILNILIDEININKLIEFFEYIDTNNSEYFIKKYNIKELYITNELSMNGNVITADKSIFKNQEFISRMYFPYEIGLKIDIIKFLLKNNIFSFNEKEINIILNLLLNYADKHANTTGVYGSYLKKNKIKNILPFYNKILFNNIIEYISKYNSKKNIKKFFKNNILNVINNINISNSVIYLDPPYNTRDYQTNYHILNYIVDLDFNPEYIKYGSKTAVPIIKNREKNISSSKNVILNNFEIILKKLINKNNNIFISYSSEGIIDIEDYKNLGNKLGFKIEIKQKQYRKYKSQKKEKEKEKFPFVYEYLIKLF